MHARRRLGSRRRFASRGAPENFRRPSPRRDDNVPPSARSPSRGAALGGTRRPVGGRTRARGRHHALPRARLGLLARGDAPRARGADGRGLIARRGSRDLRAARCEALAGTRSRDRALGGARVTCASCGTANDAGRKFCMECGTPLTLSCDACGSANAPGAKFCGECGATLASAAPATGPVALASQPIAERRLVTVLFADLVGFTAASESRDAEDTRELLSRYFDGARQVIDRYGGTIEKFIGDAVMAVWGAPVAQEDDADRAVRAALELVDAVTALGADLGAPDLHPRVG